MKKTAIVLIILLVIAGLAGGAFFLSRGKKEEGKPVSTPTPPVFVETTINERPFVSLIPSEDGHWLTLKIGRIQKAETLEYELSYTTGEGLVQGAYSSPFDLGGETDYERKILLGTESSGRYRYHEGVREGNITVRLEGGPGPRKYVSEFKLQQGENRLVSPDNEFVLEADFNPDQFYLVMPTAGLPGEITIESASLYGVFTSGKNSIKNGQAAIGDSEVYFWNLGSWELLENGSADQVGVFAGAAGSGLPELIE
ncbi:MAG: hypothetical protein JW991_03090 [Candidatus Pacebacteria bacterium]|nr:hypothetical protein [Candidatus Paceibacterota bacterium]